MNKTRANFGSVLEIDPTEWYFKKIYWEKKNSGNFKNINNRQDHCRWE